MDRSRRIAKNSLSQMLFKVVTIVSSFAIRTVFIYALGDEYTGLSSLFKSILTVLSFVELGIGTSISFALYKPIANNDDYKIAQLLRLYRKAYTIIGLAVLVLGASLTPFLDKIVTNAPNIKENLTYIYLWQLFNTALSYLFVYRVTLLTASQQDYIVSRVDSVLYIIRTIAEVIVLVVFKSYWGYLIVNSLYTVSRNIILTYISKKRYPLPNLKDADRLPESERKTVFKNVGALAIYKISDVALEGTDSIIISSFIGTGILGLYSNYYLLMTTVKYTVDQVFSSSVPTIGNYQETTQTSNVKIVMQRLTFLAFWIATFCTAAFICLIEDFISNIWLNSSKLLPFSVMVVIFVEFYICLMTRPSRTIREACGLFVQGKYRPLIMAIINIVVSIVLTKLFGLIGVILGTVVARLSTQFWYDPVIIYRKYFHESPVKYLLQLLLYSAISAVAIITTYFVTSLIRIPSVYLAFVLKIIGVVCIPNAVIVLLFFKNDSFKWSINTFKSLVLRKVKAKKHE